MADENFIDPEDYETRGHTELQFQKFKSLVHDYFDKEKGPGTDFLSCVRESARLYSFVLPPYLSDLLILYDEAPFYWLTDSPFVLSIDEYFKRRYSKIYDPENIKTLKGFYTKWATQKDSETKSYFAKSTLAMLDKNPQKNNFIFSLYQGTILTFDTINSNTEKAVEVYTAAKEMVAASEIKQSLKDDAFHLISIFCGFAYLKEGDLYKASQEFVEAYAKKETGVTAKFYLAYLSAVQYDEETARKLLQEIFLSDISKVQYAISVNSINLLSYFMANAATLNFFNERAFTNLAQFIQDLFAANKKTGPEFIDTLNNKLHILHELQYEEYYDKEINDIIPFIGKIYQTLKGSKNILLLSNADKVISKFDRIHEIIYNAISKKLYAQMKENLRPYDQQISDNAEKIRLFTTELETVKKTTNDEYESEAKIIDERAEALIKEVESHLNTEAIDKKFDPQVAFTNSMFYNLIVSFAVFVLAGLATYSNATGADSGDFKNFFSALMMGGTKWGTITFLLGLIVSIFAAASMIMEKSNYKTKLQNKISFLRQRREKDLEILKHNHSMRIKMIEQNYNNRIESAKKADEDFNAERNAEEQKQKEKIEMELQEEEAKLNQII